MGPAKPVVKEENVPGTPHTGQSVPPKPFLCNVCNKIFASKQNLMSHQKIHINLKGEDVFILSVIIIHYSLVTFIYLYFCGNGGRAPTYRAEGLIVPLVHVNLFIFSCCSDCYRWHELVCLQDMQRYI